VFLADKPRFAEVAAAFLDFLGEAPLVIHNASFDLKFVNAELERISRKPIPASRAIDTIEIAKSKIPGARYSLDELCKRFGIDLSAREKHGALLDAELTAQVYLELIGGRQKRLLLAPADDAAAGAAEDNRSARLRPRPLPSLLTADEQKRHADFVARELGEAAVWNGR
jgi:DNA polymerase-3 subunit epsilon